MTTNKERIENLEVSIGGLQDNLSKMELGVNDKLQQPEVAINKLSSVLLTNTPSSNVTDQTGQSSNRRYRENTEAGQPMFSSKLAKLEFPKYSSHDLTEWFTRVDQFFEYQCTPETQKVASASFHLEGEANQWWQWLRRASLEERKEVTWSIFVGELWSRFGPTDCKDFDEALSKIRQTGTLREYQKEFECLGNRVQGWTQKALVGTFMGGLRAKITNGIGMFKPKTLKEAISLARMRDDQANRQRRFTRPIDRPTTDVSSPTKTKAAPIKRLTWEEMQKRRMTGLCFNCDEKFTPGHRYHRAQLLLLESDVNTEISSEEVVKHDCDSQLEISLHALLGWSAPRTMRITAKLGKLKWWY
ncbi:uncharacterized protein LOC119371008 [Jatropha curcas]|uniref:uncharacterized protein LOC119371008 n=1 Tax=Jatropha curcas TaxID=180498 RepID=UPI00189506E9|nr:uncharacterized protein LOC119371008 [Jatropha curcas]